MVVSSNLQESDAILLGSDELTDLAVIRIAKEKASAVATLGDSSTINVGDTVFTVGSPEGIKYLGTVTKGIISGLNREVNMYIGEEEYIINVLQTDAAINPGNSGGPLVNINGEVIGINSLKLVQNEIEGMGFAIPIEEVLLYTDRLEQGKQIQRPYLGLELVDADNGIMITNIKYENISSDFHKGDIITKIDDVEVRDVVHFRYLLYKHEIGDMVKISYLHNQQENDVKIKLN